MMMVRVMWRQLCENNDQMWRESCRDGIDKSKHECQCTVNESKVLYILVCDKIYVGQ